MAQVIDRDRGDGNGTFNPPVKSGTSGSNKSNFSPNLLTSTGGLFGNTGALMTAYIGTNGKCYIAIHDQTSFDSEEDAEYDYPQMTPPSQYQDLRIQTYNLIMLQYRELGTAKFTISIDYYNRINDQYLNKQIPISISNTGKRKTFPDGKLHTRYIDFVISGERVQIKILRKANSGPLSIVKCIPCGSADEVPQM